MSDLTMNNINSIRYQISRKLNYNVPYYATRDATGAVITDMDHFPYKRYFRGVYYEQSPVVLEREAGFRPRRDSCYTQISIPKPSKPNYCWEYPCSTVTPCKAKKEEKDPKKCANNFVVSP
jgi:hypothetical protein